MTRSSGNADTAALVVGQSTGVAANGLSTVNVVERSLNRTKSGLAPQTLVFSIYAYKGANFTGTGITLEIVTAMADVNICSGAWTVEASATFGAATLSTAAWTRFQVTKSGSWATNAATVLGVRVKFDSPSGAAVADDALYLTGAKLELSSTGAATAYVMPTLHESLQRCKRFYQAFGGVTPEIASAGFTTGATLHRANAPVSRRDDQGADRDRDRDVVRFELLATGDRYDDDESLWRDHHDDREGRVFLSRELPRRHGDLRRGNAVRGLRAFRGVRLANARPAGVTDLGAHRYASVHDQLLR